MKNSLSNLLQSLLKKNNIDFDKNELDFQISNHPLCPSVETITGVLNHFGIDNLVLEMPQSGKAFLKLPSCFIAILKADEDENFVFVEKRKRKIKQTFLNGKSKRIEILEFVKEWTGKVVVTKKLISKTNNTNLPTYLFPFLMLMGIFLYVNIVPFSWLTIGYLSLSLAGMYVSLILVKYKMGVNSKVVEAVCNNSKKINCDSPVFSTETSIFKTFQLADLAFVYFLSSAVAIVWMGFLKQHLQLIFITSWFTVPFAVYVIYYQKFIIKKWYRLCVVITSILLLQSVIAYTHLSQVFTANTNEVLILVLSFLSVISVYSYIKPLIKTKLELSKSKDAYTTFKQSYSLFECLYTKNPILKTSIPKLTEITFGSQNAAITLVVVTNPLCGFCKKTHQAIKSLIGNFQETINVIIRFNIPIDNKDDISYKISHTLLNIYKKNKIICWTALHKIYTEGVDVHEWLATYKEYNTSSQYQILETEKQWCLNQNIHFTPTVFLNNRVFPKEYELGDLAFFFDDFIKKNPKYK